MRKLFLFFFGSLLCTSERHAFKATPCNSLAYVLAIADAQASLPLFSQKMILDEKRSPSQVSQQLWNKYTATCLPEERDVSRAVYALHRHVLAQNSPQEVNRQYAAAKDFSPNSGCDSLKNLFFEISPDEQLQGCAYLQAISQVAHERAPELIASADQARAGCGKNSDTFLGKAYYHLMRENLKDVSDETVARELKKRVAD